MKEEHGYYEILIQNHYVTFTNNTIFPYYTAENAPIQFQTIWDELKAQQRIAVKNDIDISSDEEIKLDFPQYAVLKDAIKRNFKSRFKKTPDDYSGDMSRYEFAVIGSVKVSMNLMLDLPFFSRTVKLDDKQKIMLVYNTVLELIEHRAKHDEIRDGKPMLLYQTYNSFVTNYKG